MISGRLRALLAARAEAGTPLRVGLIGAGKFGTMFLSQGRRLAGLHGLGVADLSLDRAGRTLARARVAARAGRGRHFSRGAPDRQDVSWTWGTWKDV